jgi:hypothetical protein
MQLLSIFLCFFFQAQGCMLHTFSALIICKNVFMKRLECLLHHHMTVNQHQATTVWKQKFEIINLKIQLKNWFFCHNNIHWFWEEKDSQKKACTTESNIWCMKMETTISQGQNDTGIGESITMTRLLWQDCFGEQTWGIECNGLKDPWHSVCAPWFL